MNQLGNSLANAGLQHFLDSAANAATAGQRQFFTPKKLAAALFAPFSGLAHEWVFDPHCGSGNLLASSGIGRRFGLDVDPRCATPPDGSPGWHLFHADLTRWFQLACDVGFRADLTAMNPPFSLQWDPARLKALATSPLDFVAEAFRPHLHKPSIDSTFASLLIALHLGSRFGDGFMLCNADTARRFFGDPSDPAYRPLSPASRSIWAWLLIPGAIFENQHTAFDTAVLYFSPEHGVRNDDCTAPLFVSATASDPDSVAAAVTTIRTARPFVRKGQAIDLPYLSNLKPAVEAWDAAATEYSIRHHGTRPRFNLWLEPDGTIGTFLDPYRRLSAGIDRTWINLLHDLRGRSPAALVVQTASRAALRQAAGSEFWHVDPALLAAIDSAMARYESVRAPFYTPNPVQSLGWLDEQTHITAHSPGLAGVSPGDRCAVRTYQEHVTYDATKTNLAGDAEDISLSGMELVIEITSPSGQVHHFHHRRDDNLPERSGKTHHHLLPVIFQHFEVPTPQDITHLRPADYHAHLAAIDRLQAHIRSRLAA